MDIHVWPPVTNENEVSRMYILRGDEQGGGTRPENSLGGGSRLSLAALNRR